MNWMSTGAGVLRTGYIPPPRSCTVDCKPSPDGSPALGWALIIFGGVAFVATILMLAAAGRSGPRRGAAVPEAPDRASMDRVQREDLERRDAEAAKDQDQTELTFAGVLAVVGLGCVALGWFLVANTLSAIDTHKKQLHDAASAFVSAAAEGPQFCHQSLTPNCSPSPRDYARQLDAHAVYTDFTLETVVSPNFQADGEVTFHDVTNDRALCVRVPSAVTGADTDNSITSGACPDAPAAERGTG